MSELLFAIKTLAITTVIIILMQIRINNDSVENHTHAWLQSSTPVIFFREVAEGGLRTVHDAWVSLMSNIKSQYKDKFDADNIPGRRQLKLGLERSQTYIEEQAAKKEELEKRLSHKGQKIKDALESEPDAELDPNQVAE